MTKRLLDRNPAVRIGEQDKIAGFQDHRIGDGPCDGRRASGEYALLALALHLRRMLRVGRRLRRLR